MEILLHLDIILLIYFIQSLHIHLMTVKLFLWVVSDLQTQCIWCFMLIVDDLHSRFRGWELALMAPAQAVLRYRVEELAPKILHCLCFLLMTFLLCWLILWVFICFYFMCIFHIFFLSLVFWECRDLDAGLYDLHYIYHDCNSKISRRGVNWIHCDWWCMLLLTTFRRLCGDLIFGLVAYAHGL